MGFTIWFVVSAGRSEFFRRIERRIEKVKEHAWRLDVRYEVFTLKLEFTFIHATVCLVCEYMEYLFNLCV